MKKISVVIFALLVSSFSLKAQIIEQAKSIVRDDVVFNEENGLVAVEGEHFYKQTKTSLRQWYTTSRGKVPEVKPDPDEEHIAGASGNAYIEISPDTRVTPKCKLIKLEDPTLTAETAKLVNFTDLPGRIAIVHYKVKINKPGRYYVWARIFSTGPEDNSVHVGFDNIWPENGQRMQWCDGKNAWTWASKQRTEKEHCGVPKQIFLDIAKAGVHDIQFSMREDGFEMDKFILTNDINYVPEGKGPTIKLLKGNLPPGFKKIEAKTTTATTTVTPVGANTSDNLSYIEMVGKTINSNKVWLAVEFPVQGTKFYNDKNWLAINPELHKAAKITAPFPFDSGAYDIIFLGVGENDGSSTYSIFVSDKLIGEYLPPLSGGAFEEGTNYNKLFENVEIKNGAPFTVVSHIGSADEKEYSRGRWSGLIFTKKGDGFKVMELSKSIMAK